MNDTAINYEYLIRKANHCTRYGVTGADADTFRRLERYASQHSQKNNEKSLCDYMRSIGEVSAYLKTALDVVKKNNSERLQGYQEERIEQIEAILYDTENIDALRAVIDQLTELFNELGLQAL